MRITLTHKMESFGVDVDRDLLDLLADATAVRRIDTVNPPIFDCSKNEGVFALVLDELGVER